MIQTSRALKISHTMSQSMCRVGLLCAMVLGCGSRTCDPGMNTFNPFSPLLSSTDLSNPDLLLPRVFLVLCSVCLCRVWLCTPWIAARQTSWSSFRLLGTYICLVVPLLALCFQSTCPGLEMTFEHCSDHINFLLKPSISYLLGQQVSYEQRTRQDERGTLRSESLETFLTSIRRGTLSHLFW